MSETDLSKILATKIQFEGWVALIAQRISMSVSLEKTHKDLVPLYLNEEEFFLFWCAALTFIGGK